MKTIKISKKRSAELLGRLFIDVEVITSTQLNTVKREMDNPTYSYGEKDSLWTFYNYITFALKDCNPQFWLDAQQKVHEFIINEFNIETKE